MRHLLFLILTLPTIALADPDDDVRRATIQLQAIQSQIYELETALQSIQMEQRAAIEAERQRRLAIVKNYYRTLPLDPDLHQAYANSLALLSKYPALTSADHLRFAQQSREDYGKIQHQRNVKRMQIR